MGSWGLHTQVQPRFGARAIVERSGVSLLWDRSGVYGEARRAVAHRHRHRFTGVY
ncbi:type IV toxin-antitoxin system YeeU family antitoxin [Aeromonas caviae]|uniref:type IV toxin-antitoxin system YeeU family antitoxin n=1 Tax=Aeromonas caviae TaxID=648 RepID=UPI00100C36DC